MIAEREIQTQHDLRTCAYPHCHEPVAGCCENCDTRFCEDHGSRGGDREGGSNPDGSPHGAYAVPSVCWKCGGYNADEE